MYTIVVFKVLFNTSCYSSQVLSLRLEGLVQHPAGSHMFAFYLHSEAYVQCIPVSLPKCHGTSGT